MYNNLMNLSIIILQIISACSFSVIHLPPKILVISMKYDIYLTKSQINDINF